MLRILSVFGTRPEAIKMAPVIQELARHQDRLTSMVCVTAQHRQMLDQVLRLFEIKPDYDLNLMEENQSATGVAAAVLKGLEPILDAVRPDWVLVQGDTTTVAAASLAAFYGRAKIAHIEAGLRTFDKYQPFPEEINRRVASVIADLHCAPTERSRQNLLREGVPAEHILVTGNSVIDALHYVSRLPFDWADSPLKDVPQNRRLVLVTAHRRENFGQPLVQICHALRALASRYAGDAHFVFPVHLNPKVHETVHNLLGDVAEISLLPPLDYLPLVNLLKRAYLVLTDSGGLQEEAPGLGKPVLVLRNTTERPEAVDAGTVKLIGTAEAAILRNVSTLMDDADEYGCMARAVNPYGDGQAAKRIVRALRSHHSAADERG